MTSSNQGLPPPEQIGQWLKECGFSDSIFAIHDLTPLVKKVSDWELQQCVEWLRNERTQSGMDNEIFATKEQKYFTEERLVDSRRLTPKKRALKTLDRISKSGHPCNIQDDADWAILRDAISSLPDN